MRRSFLTSYVFGAEAIIQHWFWKTLKTATKSFGPLLSVFADNYDATVACGTLAWDRIFTAFPCAGTAITHQLIESGFQHCMSLQSDTTEEFTQYMARLNEYVAQLSTVQPLALSEIYALGALMGLHQSASSHHERAYRELITYINEGNAITLDEVLKIGLEHSRDHHSAAKAFLAVHDGADVCNHTCHVCCKHDFRGRKTPCLRARVPLLGRIRQVAPAAQDALCLPRPPTAPSTSAGNPKASPIATIGSIQTFSFGGLSVWRAVVSLVFFLFTFVFGGLDQPLFATRWSCHFCFEILISF